MTTGNNAAKRAWMAEALDVKIPVHGDEVENGRTATLGPADPDSPLSLAALKPEIWTQRIGAALSAPPGALPSAPIVPARPVGPKTTCVGKSGKRVDIVVGQDGRVAMTREQPPIREVTFSGGGGKGAA